MSQARLCCLVADDDPISRGIVAEQLLRLGVGSVRSAGSGVTALKTLQASPEINLLVTDLKMPDMDGIALLRQLDKLTRPIAVIIMSALGPKILRAAAMIGVGHKLKILGISGKPVSQRHLRDMLDSMGRTPVADATGANQSAATIDADLIREALAEGQHQILVQPEVATQGEKFTAVEVLSRWTHPQLSGRSPGDVIMVAEQAGLMDELLRAILPRVGKAWKSWAKEGLSPRVSINLSNVNLADTDLPDWLSQEVGRFGINPQDLIFEVTETAMPSSGTSNLEVAFRLGLAGFQLAIDDFGTGHSSLRQLQDMPFHQLKIDKSFVDDIEQSFEARTIVESSIRMANNLGMSTVAEGVERREQLHILADMGCQLAQGYLIGKPMPPEALKDWSVQHQAALEKRAARNRQVA